MEVEVINYLVKQLEKDRCILFMGPEFIHIDTPENQQSGSILNYLAEDKFKTFFSMDKYVSEDGFFYFSSNEDKELIAKDSMLSTLGDFYAGLSVTPSYENLARIPFNTIVSLSPDKLIVQAAEKINRQSIYRKYSPKGFEDENIPESSDGKALAMNNSNPSKKSTLIYNLFGDYTDYEELIFTYDNLFKFLDRIFQDAVFPKFKERIAEANSFIFLGFSYDKWYLKLVFFLLNKFRNSSARECSKYAIFNYDTKVDDKKVDFFKCNFGLTFSPEKEKDFIETLLKAWDARKAILEAAMPHPANGNAAIQAKNTNGDKEDLKVLYLGASPDGKLILRQGEEYQIIKKQINPAWFTLLQPQYNITRGDILKQISQQWPTLIYISCHGTPEGQLILSDDRNAPSYMNLPDLTEMIKHLSEVHKQLKCIVFSACRSEIQAREISKYIPYCVGMNQNVDVAVSNVFTSGFFDGLLDKTDNVEYAFDNGISLVKNSDKQEISKYYKIPVLYHSGELFKSNLQV